MPVSIRTTRPANRVVTSLLTRTEWPATMYRARRRSSMAVSGPDSVASGSVARPRYQSGPPAETVIQFL